jgi:hypothetical protein
MTNDELKAYNKGRRDEELAIVSVIEKMHQVGYVSEDFMAILIDYMSKIDRRPEAMR